MLGISTTESFERLRARSHPVSVLIDLLLSTTRGNLDLDATSAWYTPMRGIMSLSSQFQALTRGRRIEE